MGLIGVLAASGWLSGSASASRLRDKLGVNGATILGASLTGPAALLVPDGDLHVRPLIDGVRILLDWPLLLFF